MSVNDENKELEAAQAAQQTALAEVLQEIGQLAAEIDQVETFLDRASRRFGGGLSQVLGARRAQRNMDVRPGGDGGGNPPPSRELHPLSEEPALPDRAEHSDAGGQK